MEIEVNLEAIESIRKRLKVVRGAYSAQAGNDEYAEERGSCLPLAP